jgi:hypothetical protein
MEVSDSDDFFSRPVLLSLLEKSGWLLSCRVALLLGDLGSSVVLVASDPILLAKVWPSAIVSLDVQRFRCTSCDVPIDVASKLYVASSWRRFRLQAANLAFTSALSGGRCRR